MIWFFLIAFATIGTVFLIIIYNKHPELMNMDIKITDSKTKEEILNEARERIAQNNLKQYQEYRLVLKQRYSELYSIFAQHPSTGFTEDEIITILRGYYPNEEHSRRFVSRDLQNFKTYGLIEYNQFTEEYKLAVED